MPSSSEISVFVTASRALLTSGQDTQAASVCVSVTFRIQTNVWQAGWEQVSSHLCWNNGYYITEDSFYSVFQLNVKRNLILLWESKNDVIQPLEIERTEHHLIWSPTTNSQTDWNLNHICSLFAKRQQNHRDWRVRPVFCVEPFGQNLLSNEYMEPGGFVVIWGVLSNNT